MNLPCPNCSRNYDPDVQSTACPHLVRDVLPTQKFHLSETVHIPDPQAFLLGVLSERGVRSLELIADALQTLARVESDRFHRQYPDEREKRATQINRASDEKREQFKDQADAEWMRETEAALPKSRFESRLEAQKASGTAEAAKK